MAAVAAKTAVAVVELHSRRESEQGLRPQRQASCDRDGERTAAEEEQSG
jgi:hypothetical protein